VEAGERRVDGRLIGWLSLVGALIALNYAARFATDTETVTREAFYRWATVVGAGIQFGVMLGLVLLIVRGDANRLLALRRPRSWGRAVGLMIAVFVGIFVLSAIVAALGLEPGEEQGLTPEGWDSSRAAPFAANFVVAAAFVPVVEEFLFRGAGFSLLDRYGRAAAIVGTGVLFGVGHGLIEALPILIAFGLGLAWLRHRSESIYPPILLHGIFNGVSLIAAVTLGDRVT
jgi:membrane protease YdiL (CAAX protease family)